MDDSMLMTGGMNMQEDINLGNDELQEIDMPNMEWQEDVMDLMAKEDLHLQDQDEEEVHEESVAQTSEPEQEDPE
jgi:hypothetical protein